MLPPDIHWAYHRVRRDERFFWLEDVDATMDRLRRRRTGALAAHLVRRVVSRYGASVFDLVTDRDARHTLLGTDNVARVACV